MKIAIIGTGHVGGALASKWAGKGHEIHLGVRDTRQFKGMELLKNQNTTVHPVLEAVALAETVVIATPAMMAVEVAQSLGNTTGKVVIDTMNIVMGRGPSGYTNTTDALWDHTDSRDIVKCFNTTGYNNMVDPVYEGMPIDMFMAGDSERGCMVARQLALDAGFGECHRVGGNDKFQMMEQFACFWINLAMFQGMGREIAFRLMRR